MTNEITPQELIKLVKEEAKYLKINASIEELERLDFETFNPQKYAKCIYGQMTGDCDSERSVELIQNSCVRVTRSRDYNPKDTTLNVNPFQTKRCYYFSPIELFVGLENNKGETVNQYNGNNIILINYLQGKTETLEFSEINFGD
jgi:hypothetical protein